eukprot:4591764-Prymnesium_polylepis.1
MPTAPPVGASSTRRSCLSASPTATERRGCDFPPPRRVPTPCAPEAPRCSSPLSSRPSACAKGQR